MSDHDLQVSIIDIDFLPAKYREENARRKVHAWRTVVVALFVLLVAVAGWMQHQTHRELAAELALVTQQHEAADAQMLWLSELHSKQIQLQARAELITLLQHPWPRTQILAAVVEPLPKSITLEEIRVTQETIQKSAAASRRTVVAPEKAEKLEPAKQDLEALRGELENTRTIVLLAGTTTDVEAMHFYLARLGEHRLIEKSDLRSLERSTRNDESSEFRARLVVRPPYGQPGGSGMFEEKSVAGLARVQTPPP